MQAVAAKDGSVFDSTVSARAALARVALGLLQGLCLFALYRAATESERPHWPANQPYLFATLSLWCVVAPVLLISSLGHLRVGQAVRWIGVALLVMAGLACHDIWHDGFDTGLRLSTDAHVPAQYPSYMLYVVGCAGFFIAQSLVQAAFQDGRRIATYDNYFESAWKLALQLTFSLFFVGVVWLILILGASMFMLVKLYFLRHYMDQPWFAIPVCCAAFSCGMHLTDVRPAIVRGIRTLLLVLMSWILPLAALLVAGFLLSLPFTGFAALWATRHATAVLLGVDLMLVIFINAAFQNGAAAHTVAGVVRLSARLAAVLLLPITAIGAHALSLRVADYGWTTDRIIAACCPLLAACYAIGYAWAACRRGIWLAAIARANVLAAFLILAILLALFSPVADPARLSVDDQMARFAAGRITPEDLDVKYLRFEGARYGRAALQGLQAGVQGPGAALLRERATHVLAMETRRETRPETAQAAVEGPVDLAVNLALQPVGAQLPASFVAQRWSVNPESGHWPICLTQRGERCEAFILGPDSDGRAQVLIIGDQRRQYEGAVLLAETADAGWRRVGSFSSQLAQCAEFKRQLGAGDFSWIAPMGQDMLVNGERLKLETAPQQRIAMCQPGAR